MTSKYELMKRAAVLLSSAANSMPQSTLTAMHSLGAEIAEVLGATMPAESMAEAVKDLKMLHGLPPYDGGSNHCQGDGYFVKSLERKYGMTLSELELASGFLKVLAEWRAIRDAWASKTGGSGS